MIRKKRDREDEENPDRWVVSYADFITLLFAFFTTMYAISHVDQGKLERFAGSVKTAFKARTSEHLQAPVIDGLKPPEYADVALEKEAREEFTKFAILERIAVGRDQRGVIISLGDELLFPSGSSDLRQEAQPVLAAAASLIRKTGRTIFVEGHTDNMPLRNSRYASNMELSAMRAATIYQYLLQNEGVDPGRMSIAGYGEYRPIAPNATLEGRTRNRRVDILFVTRKDGA